jgi:ABC-type phosphate transport system substrate-binding protein
MRIMPILTLLVASLLSTGQHANAAEPAIIAHPSVDSDTVDADMLQAFYLGKKRDWPDGTHVRLTVNQSEPVHAAFLDTWVGKSPSGFTGFWKRIVFTGKGKMPDSFSDDATVIEAVASTPGAIGYVDAGSTSDRVKRLEVRK